MTVCHDQMTVGCDHMTASCDQTTVGMGYYYLSRPCTNFENFKAIHLVWVTDEETKYVRMKTNSHLVTNQSFGHRKFNPGIKSF